MALWNEQSKSKADDSQAAAPVQRGAPSAPQRSSGKSVIDAGLTFHGTVEGEGDILIAGQFEGDVDIRGNLTIESGARLTGSVAAAMIRIAGELEGNVVRASSVELQETGMVNGDITAGTLTVAAGSRMRGRADVGFGDAEAAIASRAQGKGGKAGQPAKSATETDGERESAA